MLCILPHALDGGSYKHPLPFGTATHNRLIELGEKRQGKRVEGEGTGKQNFFSVGGWRKDKGRKCEKKFREADETGTGGRRGELIDCGGCGMGGG